MWWLGVSGINVSEDCRSFRVTRGYDTVHLNPFVHFDIFEYGNERYGIHLGMDTRVDMGSRMEAYTAKHPHP